MSRDFLLQIFRFFSTTPAENFATGTAGVVDTGGKFATGVDDTGGNTLSCEYLRDFSKKKLIALMVYSGARGETDS